jgi:myo-inositol 2-dehydrogenase / D-chiro-inositol 1-dehydrogenase
MDQNTESKSRRKFISDAAALGLVGAIGTSHFLSSCSSKKDTYESRVFLDRAPDGPPLKAGLIGCGGRGTGAAVNFLNAGPNLQVTALGDVFQDRLDIARKALKDGQNLRGTVNLDSRFNTGIEIPDENCFVGFDAYKRVIDSDVDVVLLTTPPFFRPEHLEYAVQARKHAFIEKPCAVDPVGARSIMASAKMAEAAGLSIAAGTQLRHNRTYNATFAKVKNGAIGKLIGGNTLRLQGGGLVKVAPQEGWSDMEEMLRNWTAWSWLSGNHWVEQFVHHIDVLNWYFEKFPVEVIGFGGRHQLNYGDMYNHFSVDHTFDDGIKYYGIGRRIPGCYNRSGNHLVYGTKGYTNCDNKIWDYEDNLIWEYEAPQLESEQSRHPNHTEQVHIDLVTAIRTNNPINEANDMASSSLTAIMGRESAYTGELATWDGFMNSNLRLGPTEIKMGPVNVRREPPVPGAE